MVNDTTYITKLEMTDIIEMMAEDVCKGQQLPEVVEYVENETSCIVDGEYLCNISCKKVIYEYAERLPTFHNPIWSKRLVQLCPNFGNDDNESDSIIILQSYFYEKRGVTLDEDSARAMIPLVKTEVDDLTDFDDITEWIENFKVVMESCEWVDEEYVENGYESDLEKIPTTYNNGNEIDSEDRIDMMIEQLGKEGYTDLHKLDTNNYLIFEH